MTQTDEQILEMIGQEQQGQVNEMSGMAYNNLQGQENNLIVWQLELDNILERIEHLLKGDVLVLNNETREVEYQKPKDNNLIILNEYGVQLIMNIITFYLNRNTILSNYKRERVDEILYDLGYELADLIFINYEKMGLDNVTKRSRINVLIMNILHMLESTYNRALNGEEKASLRTARVVTQTQPIGQVGLQQMHQTQRGFSFNPLKGFKK